MIFSCPPRHFGRRKELGVVGRLPYEGRGGCMCVRQHGDGTERPLAGMETVTTIIIHALDGLVSSVSAPALDKAVARATRQVCGLELCSADPSAATGVL